MLVCSERGRERQRKCRKETGKGKSKSQRAKLDPSDVEKGYRLKREKR